MSSLKEIRDKIELPAISQICLCVRDANEMAKQYSSKFGLGPWTTYEFIPDKLWYGEKPSYLKLLLAKAMWGDVELVLQQPLEASFTFYSDFLSEQGEGVLNFAFNIENYDETFKKFVKAGFEPLMRCDSYIETYNGYLKACYFDTRSMCGILMEICERSWLK